MENGTVIFKDFNGCTFKADVNSIAYSGSGADGVVAFSAVSDFKTLDHPEPFNDGEYLHYTRFHPQLKDMIGTDGYFYDEQIVFMGLGRLSGVNKDGCPMNDYRAFSYFAVPIEKPKTEITLQEIADKFGVEVEQLRIKE